MFLGDIPFEGWLAIGFIVACVIMGKNNNSSGGKGSSTSSS